jgi:hypothetical protein
MTIPNWTALVQSVGSLATAVGVFLAWRQLVAAKEQARSQFEDGMVKQYRTIIGRLPVEALLGQELDEEQQARLLGIFYGYIDLCNEQAFLYLKKRVRKETWSEWKAGIESHFRLPAFRRAWLEIHRRAPNSFAELRQEVAFTPEPPAIAALG